MWYHQESNRGHKDFQSFALPTELWHHPDKRSVPYYRGAKVSKKFNSANITCDFVDILSLPARQNPPFRWLAGQKEADSLWEPASENPSFEQTYRLGSVLLQPSFCATPKPALTSSTGIGYTKSEIL